MGLISMAKSRPRLPNSSVAPVQSSSKPTFRRKWPATLVRRGRYQPLVRDVDGYAAAALAELYSSSMHEMRTSTPAILERLEAFYGSQEPCWPTDPYSFLVWWHCGYPASDVACARGWESVNKSIGVRPEQLLTTSTAKLTSALAAGGMVPERRAMRLKEIAARVESEFAGDLRGRLLGALPEIRKMLKRFPNIADPGVDRILLFAGIAPVAAVPSNCPHVLVRIQRGRERENYGVTYREAQQAIATEIGENLGARTRAYLLLKRHGQELCKRTKPKCDRCPVNTSCAFFAGSHRGRAVIS
jgi:endonuclease-3